MKDFEFQISNHEKRTPAFLAAVLLLSDQITKYLFSDSVLAYCNPGGPWGIPADNGALIAVMTAVLAGVGYLFWKREEVSLRIAFSFILAGGFSNLFDRIVFGCVRDYSVFSWFPAFNLADAFLTVGATLLLFAILAGKK